jgi:hypothetical protein
MTGASSGISTVTVTQSDRFSDHQPITCTCRSRFSGVPFFFDDNPDAHMLLACERIYFWDLSVKMEGSLGLAGEFFPPQPVTVN